MAAAVIRKNLMFTESCNDRLLAIAAKYDWSEAEATRRAIEAFEPEFDLDSEMLEKIFADLGSDLKATIAKMDATDEEMRQFFVEMDQHNAEWEARHGRV